VAHGNRNAPLNRQPATAPVSLLTNKSFDN